MAAIALTRENAFHIWQLDCKEFRKTWKEMKEHQFAVLMLKIGHGLRRLRIEKGYENLRKFTSDHKLPMIQYWRVEKGKTNMTIKTLMSLLAIHDLTVQEFFCWLKSIRVANGQMMASG